MRAIDQLWNISPSLNSNFICSGLLHAMTKAMAPQPKSGEVQSRLFLDLNSAYCLNPHEQNSCIFLPPRWLQDANSPALSGKVGVKRAASVGGQQFAKVDHLNVNWFDQLTIFYHVCLCRLQKLVSEVSIFDPEKIIILVQEFCKRKLFSCFKNLARENYFLGWSNSRAREILQHWKIKVWFSIVPGTLLTPMRFSKTNVFFEYIAMRIAAEIVTFWW